MSEFVTLSCPSCGGRLEITSDIERFACAHCGKEHLVNRGGGIVSIRPLMDGLLKVQTGVDKTASELAIVRLEAEIPALEKKQEEKLRELSANAGLLEGLPTRIKQAETERMHAHMRLMLAALAVVLAVWFLVEQFGGPKSLFDWAVYATLCWGPVALVALAQVARVNSAVREQNRLKKHLAQMTEDWPRQKALFDDEIAAIENAITTKKQELAEHQARVST